MARCQIVKDPRCFSVKRRARPFRTTLTRPGSLTHASADAAVAGAAGETVNVLVDVVLGALSTAVPEAAIAAGSGSALAGIYAENFFGPRIQLN